MDSSMKSQEMGPDSAGSTAVMGAVLREMHRSFAVLLGFEGTIHKFSLLNWAGLCFYCYRCASATPEAIWALWGWIWHLIEVQVPQNKMISFSILISPSSTSRCIPGCIDVHDMLQQFVLHASIDFSSFWFIHGNAVMLGEIVLQRDLACCLLWGSPRLMAVQGHQSSGRALSPQVL